LNYVANVKGAVLSRKIAKKTKTESSRLGTIALRVSILAGIIGVFGGVPGLKQLFFDKPSILVQGFMPVVVFDEGSSLDSIYPKFSLNGILKVSNRNNFDVSINEMKVYGKTQDSSGKYKFSGNKPVLYQLNLVGTAEKGDDIVKSHASSFIRFRIAYFDNTEDPGMMRGPMKAVGNTDLGHPIFHIFFPSFNQLFKWNDHRIPNNLVDHVGQGKLSFAVVFNNELVQIQPRFIYYLHHCGKDEWENITDLIRVFNAKASM
jgi:hypothetical protein